MNKLLLLLLTSVLAIGLAACGGSDTEDASKPEDKQETKDETKKEVKEKEKKEDDNVQESDLGKLTMVQQNKEINESTESGPIKLTINSIHIGDMEVAEDYRDTFDNKEKVTVIELNIKVENSTDDTITFYPEDGTLTTDGGDQTDVSIGLSDLIGGEFFGKVNKEGNLYFLVDTPAAEIGEINFIVDGPHNEDFDNVGVQIKMTLSTK